MCIHCCPFCGNPEGYFIQDDDGAIQRFKWSDHPPDPNTQARCLNCYKTIKNGKS